MPGLYSFIFFTFVSNFLSILYRGLLLLKLLLHFDQCLSLTLVVIWSLGHGDGYLNIAIVTNACERSKAGVIFRQELTSQVSTQSKIPIKLVVQVAHDRLFAVLIVRCHFVVLLEGGQILNAIDLVGDELVFSRMTS